MKAQADTLANHQQKIIARSSKIRNKKCTLPGFVVIKIFARDINHRTFINTVMYGRTSHGN